MTPTRLIGLSEEEALALCEHYNYTMRVLREDHTFYYPFGGYIPTRINIGLEKDKVVEVTIG